MRFCERYPEIAERFDRFWRGAETDRPLMYVSFPKDGADRAAKPPAFADPAERLRPENMVAAARYKLATVDYCAEGFPHVFVNFGPGVLHACIGGELHVRDERTVWFPPFVKDIGDFTKLRFDVKSPGWKSIAAATTALLDAVGDEMVMSFTDIGGNADVLASAVGTEQLLMDCLDRPEDIKAAVRHVHTLWWQAYEANAALFAGRQDVTTTWYPFISRRRVYMTQCDFSAMIGPDPFRELFAPELWDTWKRLDNPAFHLDGVGTEVHVPALLAAGKVQCVQWVPPPTASALEQVKMLREIQEAGVSVTIGIKKLEEVVQACRELDPRRLMLIVGCRDAKQARAVVEDALRASEKS
jgi:hypothetical protein